MSTSFRVKIYERYQKHLKKVYLSYRCMNPSICILCVCFFGCTIITRESVDQFSSNFIVERWACSLYVRLSGLTLKEKLIFQVNLASQASLTLNNKPRTTQNIDKIKFLG